MKEINLEKYFYKTTKITNRPWRQTRPGASLDAEARPGSAIIHPGSSRGSPTSRIRHGSILRLHFDHKKYRFRLDGCVFDPKTSITSKCVGGLQGEYAVSINIPIYNNLPECVFKLKCLLVECVGGLSLVQFPAGSKPGRARVRIPAGWSALSETAGVPRYRDC